MAGSVGGAGARACVGEVQPGRALRQHRGRCDGAARVEIECERFCGRSGCSHRHRAKVHSPGHNLLHRIVALIANEDVSAAVHRHAKGCVEAAAQHIHRGAGVDRAAGCAAGARHNLIHRTVGNIGDEDVPAAVHRNATGTAEAAAQHIHRGAGVYRAAGCAAGARHNLLHRIVASIANENVSVAVHSNTIERGEATAHGADRGAGVDRAACCAAGARYNLLNRIVAPVCDEDVSAAVHRHACGRGEATAHGVDRGAGVDRAACCTAGARQNLLHRTVASISDEDVSAAVHCHAIGLVEAAAHSVDRGAAGDDAAHRYNLLHRIVVVIGDEDVSAAVHRRVIRCVEAAAQRAHSAAEVRRLRRQGNDRKTRKCGKAGETMCIQMDKTTGSRTVTGDMAGKCGEYTPHGTESRESHCAGVLGSNSCFAESEE